MTEENKNTDGFSEYELPEIVTNDNTYELDKSKPDGFLKKFEKKMDRLQKAIVNAKIKQPSQRTPWEQMAVVAYDSKLPIRLPRKHKKCNGTGYTGISVETGSIIPCTCILGNYEREREKQHVNLNYKTKRKLSRANMLDEYGQLKK